MRDIDLYIGLGILLSYRRPGYNLDAQQDELWLGKTETPLEEEDFDKMIKLGFTVVECSIKDEEAEFPSYSDYLNDKGESGWYTYT